MCLFFSGFLAQNVYGAWYLSDWQFRKQLRIDSSRVAGDLNNFPVLINTTDLDWRDTANGGNVTQADGGDIVFTAADGTTKLDHEIERYDPTTGELIAWVEVPTLSGSTDTDLYIYYGNSVLPDAQNQWDVNGTWDEDGNNNFKAVLHLSESPNDGVAGHLDSTSNNNLGTPLNFQSGGGSTNATGKIGGADYLAGDDDMITVLDSSSLDATNDEATFSLWINWVDAADDDYQIVMSSSNRFSGGPNDGYEWASQSSGNHFFYPWGGDNNNYNLGPNPFNNGTWHHLVVTLKYATTEVDIYVDGTPMSFTTENVPTEWTTLASPDDWLWGGNPLRSGRYFNGTFDEIRVSDLARTAAWIETEYNNQSDPSSFYTVGPGPLVNQIHYRWRNDDGGETGGNPSWWDSDYQYRKQLTVTAGSSDVPSDYSVSVTFDHASLVPGKSQIDGDDIRILYWNGSSWAELDRALQEGSSWNTGSTIVWFKTQAAISASNSDSDYYLYYDYDLAASPPANKSNIYDFWDDFDDASLEAGWSLDGIGSAAGGSTNESGTVVTISATNTGDIWGTADSAYHLARSKSGDFVAESYTTNISGTHHTWSKYGGVHLRDTTAAGSKNANMSEVYSAVGATHSYRIAINGTTAETTSANKYDYNRIIRSGGTAKGYQSNDGVTWTQIGGTVNFTGGLSDPVRIGPILSAINSAAHSVDVDWFKIRLYVDPEPTTAVGAEEPQSSVSATWAAAEDVKLIGLSKQTVKRLRFMVSNEEAVSDGGVSYQLLVAQTTDPTGVDCPTESYKAVEDAGETHWEIVATDNITEPEVTYDIDPGLTNAATTFVSGELKDSGDATGSITLNGDEFTEIEFAIQATTGATDAGEYCFKLVKDGTPDEDLDIYSMYAQVNLAGATAVKLLSFDAKSSGNDVNVSWQTAHEVNNLGFHVYRSEAKAGPYQLLTEDLIPGAQFNTMGKSYEYIDKTAIRYRLYYYRLEDIDTSGKRTSHGPVCVDWDADGMPDDWEIENGLDPRVDDSMLDPDGDGLTNKEEYERGSDPNNPDTDGDGILDGDEEYEYRSQGSRALSRGVHIVSSDETGVTLELYTDEFEAQSVREGGDEFDKLSISQYVHGYTTDVCKPQLPLKGILVDIPQGKSAQLTVEDVSGKVAYGYQVVPVAETFATEDNNTQLVNEVFAIDQAAYAQDAFYPAEAAALDEVYLEREQLKQQLVFYPLSFNPVTGQLRHYKRIRVRLDYVDDYQAKTQSTTAQPWSPDTNPGLLAQMSTLGRSVMTLLTAPLADQPMAASLSSLGLFTQALWVPPELDGEAYKLLTDTAGIYQLTGAYLDISGVDILGQSTNDLRLYQLGTEVAISVYDDNGNGLFDAADHIQFYAGPVADDYAKYSKHNVYWLTTAGGQGSAARMAVVDGTPDVAPATTEHEYTLHYELDESYWQEAPGPDSLDRWFDARVAVGGGAPAAFNLPIEDITGDGLGTLRLPLYGGYDTEHEVSISFEGRDLGTFTWSGYTDYEVVIEDVDLTEDPGDGDTDYTLTVTCVSDPDAIAFDWIEVTYPRAFTAVADTLTVTHDTGFVYTIADFSTDALQAYDISDPQAVARVSGFDIPEVAAPFSLSFESAADGDEHTFLVVADTQINTTVAAIAEDAASDLADTDNGADYILITHGDLGWDGLGDRQPWVQTLIDLREDQDLRVKVVNVQDIYDEFSYGHVSAQAIKDFLTYAYENYESPAPQYVLLVGDTSYDYKDLWGMGTVIHVPAYLTYTDYMGETVTDEWFVCVSGDDAVPDMYIGRLPAKTATEASDMVAKIQAYETAANTKGWEKNVLLVADDRVLEFEAVFEAMNDDAAALLPTDMNADKRYLQEYLDQGLGAGKLSTDLLTQMEAGALVVNFSGHGYWQGWTDDAIFDAAHVDTLNTTGHYPFIVSMSCLTGYFAYPEAWTESLAEVLLREVDRGTAAALMPTGITTTVGQHVLNNAIFETMFTEDERHLGPAIAQAKQVLLANGDAYFEQISQTFMLFGDPAMKLKVPLPNRPEGLVGQYVNRSTAALSWDDTLDCDNNPVAGYNVYRSTSASSGYVRLNGHLIDSTKYVDPNAAVSGGSGADAAAANAYYYVVTAVGGDGLESVHSASVSPVMNITDESGNGGAGGGGGGCFISTVQ